MKPPVFHPPKRAQQFLHWFLREELLEEVLGDLEEQFYDLCEEKSPRRAKLYYWYQVLHYLRPFALRIGRRSPSNHFGMYRHYVKIGWRNLSKEKMYSTIKIGGFALGIAACFLIALFVQDELSYDTHYQKGDRIYRLLGVDTETGEARKGLAFPAPIGQVLKNDFPDIELSGRLIPYDWYDAGDNQFRPIDAEENLYEKGFAYADPSLMEVLEIQMIYGKQELALAEPNTLVMSKRKADKYFPNQDPVGQLVVLNENESTPYKVGGVMENFPSNSHLQYDFFLTLAEKEFWEGEQASWCCWNYDSYMRIGPHADPVEMEEKLLLIRDNYILPYSIEQGEVGAEANKDFFSFELQAISDVHLRSNDIHDLFQHGDIRIVWLFAIIAGFILLLACINFINLSTAKSANRAKEVGLRKVVGSLRSNLVRQFLTESLVVSLISFGIGLFLAWALLPYFNVLADKSLIFPWSEWWLLPVLIGAILLTGVLAGVYPALYLSAFPPIQALQGKLSKGSKNATLRAGLVIFQFTTSIVLIICTLISYQQLNFLLNKKIGFDKEQVLLIQGANTLGDQQETFLQRVENLAEVEQATISNHLPVAGTKRDFNPFWKDGRSKLDEAVSAQIWRVDEEYITTLGMKIVEGRDFDPRMASDSSALIINQTMARELGLDNPIGEKVMNWQTYTVIGVVEDFHFESLRQEIVGLCFALGNHGSFVAIKLRSDDMSSSIEAISSLWKSHMPNQPIRYSFLDQEYASMYEDVKRTGNVFTVFAILAIIVACLGLFALSAYMVEQRRKEISIRKVVGASFQVLFGLLTFNFLRLILVSLILAVPIGWYAMDRWLQEYATHIDLSWWPFVIAGALTLAIAVLTISYESIRVVRMNPADALRSD